MQPEATSLQLRAGRKRKLVVDAVDGRPAVDMDGRKMRALMVDRAPLLTRRGWQAPDAAASSGLLPEQVLPRPHTGAHARGDDRPLERPVVAAVHAKLLGLFDGMLRLPRAAEASPAKVCVAKCSACVV